MCVITERVVWRRRGLANDMAVLNGLHRRATVVVDGGPLGERRASGLGFEAVAGRFKECLCRAMCAG